MRGSVAQRRDWRSRPLHLIALCAALALASPAPAAGRLITRLDLRPGADHTAIALFTADREPLEVASFSLQDPPRLVFDFPGAHLDPELATEFPVPAPALARLRLGQFQRDPDIARLVVDLEQALPAPECTVEQGEQPGETRLILRTVGPALIRPPEVEAGEDAVLVRLPGAGGLPRKVGALQEPVRVYADLTNALLEGSYRRPLERGPVREVRMGQQAPEGELPVARLALELRMEQAYSFYCEGPDLVVAIGPHPWALPLSDYQPAGRLKGRTIVVDPGHGGHDTGAPAVFGPQPQGPFEKDIVLDIGLRLARLLRAEGARVAMTRDDDTFVSLRDRAELANRLGADAFVSIHCDSCDRPGTLHGTSVYYDHGHSHRFAHLVQEELVSALGTRDRGVRNANFAVIRRAQVPGVLVETAYINHPDDLARLVNPEFRERAARAIAQGLIRFLEEAGR